MSVGFQVRLHGNVDINFVNLLNNCGGGNDGTRSGYICPLGLCLA